MFVFFTQFRNLCKISIFWAFSGSFAVKNDIIHLFFAVLVANFEFDGMAPQQKYMAWTVSIEIVRTAKSQQRKTQLARTGFAIEWKNYYIPPYIVLAIIVSTPGMTNSLMDIWTAFSSIFTSFCRVLFASVCPDLLAQPKTLRSTYLASYAHVHSSEAR